MAANLLPPRPSPLIEPRAEQCPDCSGSGANPKTGGVCDACYGLGEIYCLASSRTPYAPINHRTRLTGQRTTQ
ncbi:hypothetical protein GCM10009612_14430 [Streptomyces beijiangensis]